jgi:iron-sulfur cluster repair protein YtfE (RIC family)
MKPPRRHDSLIPLSREHHYGLLLCLRISRGLSDQGGDEAWRRTMAADTISFFEADLTTHFRAEETVLFPAMSEMAAARDLLGRLDGEHRRLEDLVAQLRHAEGEDLARTLAEFGRLLEAHIRAEERALFPLYEQQVRPEVAARVGREILDLIGPALRPRDPEILRPHKR